MVALSLPHPTVDAIDEHYAARKEERFPRRLSARLLAGCERAGWYAFRWAHEPKEFGGKFARANMGRAAAMLDLAQCLSDIGVHVQRVDPKSFTAREVLAADGHYRQQVAGTAKGILEAPTTEHLLYLDQQPAKVVGQIQKHGLDVARPDRMVPIQVGMHVMGLTRCFYLVRNKDSDELWSERVEYDASHAAALLAKADRIVRTEAPPPRINEHPKWFECQGCAALPVCHQGQFALRTCRTCLHSTAAPTGRWLCDKHEIELSIEEQEAGCPHHLYLPGLVPGVPDDADEVAETVTYQLANGKIWTDGRAA